MADRPPRRRDLAAMITPLGRALTAAELPILRAHNLSMWGYIVLNALDGRPAPTQAALANAIGADKTRIIPILDDLQGQGLIHRDPDPADRRARLITITAQGSRLRTATQTAIQRNEERVLAHLPPSTRRTFLRALDVLSSLPPNEITGAG
jgi:DNA-binding MarR family transcriptional regulator